MRAVLKAPAEARSDVYGIGYSYTGYRVYSIGYTLYYTPVLYMSAAGAVPWRVPQSQGTGTDGVARRGIAINPKP